MINKKDIPYKYKIYKDKREMIVNAHANVENYVLHQIPDYVKKISPEKTDIVLDIGSGPGLLARELAPMVATMHCCDINSQYLSFAKETCANFDNVVYNIVENLEAPLSFLPDNSITKAYSTNCLIHNCTETIINYLRELNRVLKPGGIFWARYCTSTKKEEKFCDWIESSKKDIDLIIESLGFLTIENNEEYSNHDCCIVVNFRIQKQTI